VIRRTHCVATLLSLVLLLDGCGGRMADTPVNPAALDLQAVLSCTDWTDDQKKQAGIGESEVPEGRFENIRTVIHLMAAHIKPRDYKIERAWVLAPADDALTSTRADVLPGSPPPEIEFWTFGMIRNFFSVDESTGTRKDGRVNQILREAFLSDGEKPGKPWDGPSIRLTLVDGEKCKYSPRALRADGLARDSMPTPQTSVPWANQTFRSINRLFTNERPRVLHVFLWWSVNELEIDGIDAVLGGAQGGGSTSWGYSRSAARGGPALWVGSFHCLQHPFIAPGTRDKPLSYYHARCAKVIAHEVGHALGLHHVEQGYEANLMFFDPAGEYHSDTRKNIQLSIPQRQQMVQEAREQFGPE